ITRLLPALLGTQLAADDPGQQAEGIRSLFGLLEFAAVLCEGRRDAAASQLAGRIDALIEPMTGHRALAPQLLQQACQTLEQMLQRHRRAGAAVEHRVIESCEGQQRLDDARRAAGKEIGLSFVGRKIPAVLAELLDEVIRPNLVLARLQSEAQVWESQLAALQALADACRQARQGELQIAADDLAGVLAEAWSQVAAATPRSDELLAAVVTALSSGEGAWIAYHAPDTGHTATSASTRLPAGSGAGALELLRAGDWFGFNVAGADPRLLKLAWMAPDRSRFVFVNQLGHKAEDLGSEQLAQLLREESVRLLDERDASTIERAWRRMLEGLHNQLAEQATHDALTGLLNRTELDRRLAAVLAGPQRESMALLWIGVDHLRMLNENHGMAAGDAALVAVAQNLRRFVEQRQAQAARIAGDEFALLLTDVSEDGANGIARTLCREIAERELQWQGERFRLAVSIGLVSAGAEPTSAESLLQDAERAYRLARENGGGRVYRHTDDDHRLAKLRQTAAWVGRLEQALAQRQLLLYAQPALSLSDTARQGPDYVEVLLRLQADGEIWTPEQFLLAAERYGQIGSIDRFVCEELLRQLRTVVKGPALRVAFNLSARNLVDNDFVNELVARLRQQEFPLQQLCVELTETAAVAHLSEARTGMQRLSDLGLSMVLDDFGSGYASYQYLKHLPVDLVKVDGAFIRDIAQSPENLALARSINEIAHLLGKQTVAEHVEDEDTLALVREIGFDYAQGFHICRPEPFADFMARLRAGA
ncbi:MAG: DUF1631 family protein, partial [Xanthomonadales bacterium]|nr:DUF1631 family protein [Xanthomonadales bacterium]